MTAKYILSKAEKSTEVLKVERFGKRKADSGLYLPPKKSRTSTDFKSDKNSLYFPPKKTCDIAECSIETGLPLLSVPK
ncbi:hypothetical protein INT47_001225 [Mucor saturninus]|uniref:Uncharacterized protein n=1 Tax=Mucor saturninus TaxID=64648 RepID=A0A8H7RMR5_9FUNG|nr:hypothetical protein INT47_001225 [Mucor saturninus]